ncbi:MAG: hypothetical protein K0B81_06130 [Candidatus Cloacimonetes bacterium]|nr:hypothetical protein [Candidatus Cloacimonadota bacterium]
MDENRKTMLSDEKELVSNAKVKSLIDQAIHLFNLDLSGLTILTEAANGNYYITPVIAALSGARVLALARDSNFGSKDDVADYVSHKIKEFSLDNEIKIIYDLNDELIFKSDIVTNLGHLRPLDASFIGRMNPQAVITSMCEDWEVRAEDIDLEECRRRGILVGAVNEESSYVNIFQYVGFLTMKLIMEAGLEIYNNSFLVISSDKFGKVINDSLLAHGSSVNLKSPADFHKLLTHEHNYQAIIIADFYYDNPLVAEAGVISAEILHMYFPDTMIIHLVGEVDNVYLQENHIYCYPEKKGYRQRMSQTLDYLGMRPLIELHTASLKVGEILTCEKKAGYSAEEIITKLAHHPLCQIIF